MTNCSRNFIFFIVTVNLTFSTFCSHTADTVDTSPPFLSSITPGDGAIGVPAITPLKVIIIFNEALDTRSFSLNSADNTCSGVVQIGNEDFSTCHRWAAAEATFSNDNSTATMSTRGNLGKCESLKKIKITTEVKDATGNSLISEIHTSFETAGCSTDV